MRALQDVAGALDVDDVDVETHLPVVVLAPLAETLRMAKEQLDAAADPAGADGIGAHRGISASQPTVLFLTVTS